MRIGVGSYAFRWSIGTSSYRPTRAMQPSDLVRAAAALGADFVQIADNMPLHAEPADSIAEIAAVSRETMVAIELGTHSAEPQHLDQYLALARRLEAGVLRLTLSTSDLAMDSLALEAQLARSADAFAEIGCLIALENHFLLPSRDLASLVERLGHANVAVCLDVANSIANGEWPRDTIDGLAHLAGNLHIKDFDIQLDPDGVGMTVVGLPLGQGRTDIAHLLDSLRRSPRKIDAVIEHWLPKTAFSSAEEATRIENEWTRISIETLRKTLSAQIPPAISSLSQH